MKDKKGANANGQIQATENTNVNTEVTENTNVTENTEVKPEAPETKPEPVAMNIIVDAISHGAMKKGAFAFSRNGKPVPVPGFPVMGPTEHYNYSHSCDNGVWDARLGKYGIKSFADTKNEAGVQADYNSWKTNTLHAIMNLMTSGQLDRKIEKDGVTYDVRVSFTGEPAEYPAAEITYSTKTQKAKAVKEDLQLLFA